MYFKLNEQDHRELYVGPIMLGTNYFGVASEKCIHVKDRSIKSVKSNMERKLQKVAPNVLEKINKNNSIRDGVYSEPTTKTQIFLNHRFQRLLL